MSPRSQSAWANVQDRDQDYLLRGRFGAAQENWASVQTSDHATGVVGRPICLQAVSRCERNEDSERYERDDDAHDAHDAHERAHDHSADGSNSSTQKRGRKSQFEPE